MLLYIGIAALILTLLVKFVFKADKNILMSFVQNYCGALFIFSGLVKAVDPLGTAYKMEDYFNEFYYTLEPTWLSFLNPLITTMHDYSIYFSVFMIVFEIVLGIMLILGVKPKLTAWLFFLLILFFLVLTGFTYLTGYVPGEVNFFSFSEWGPYVKSNMKVTDCGCFGDFIKLEPYTSFLKDVALLVPAIYFIWRNKDMHQLWSSSLRGLSVVVSSVGLLIYCLSNFSWDLPHLDFRPFKNGADIAQIREAETESASNVQILAYRLKNAKSGKVEEIPSAQYLSMLSEGQYKKEDGWEVIEQVLSEPAIPETKISEFFIEDFEGNDLNDTYLANPEYKLQVISHKMYADDQVTRVEVKRDTILKIDTIINKLDTSFVESIKDIVERKEENVDYIWDKSYMDDFREIVAPLAVAAKKDGLDMAITLGGATVPMAVDFATELAIPVNYESADNILLKTIVRSNPGFVLWKDGKIVHKWHKANMPTYDELKSKYLK